MENHDLNRVCKRPKQFGSNKQLLDPGCCSEYLEMNRPSHTSIISNVNCEIEVLSQRTTVISTTNPLHLGGFIVVVVFILCVLVCFVFERRGKAFLRSDGSRIIESPH